MKSTFIAVGGMLLATAAMATTMVGTAAADGERDHKKSLCVLEASQDATWLRIDHHSVTAGTRDADACKGRVVFDDKHDDDDDDKKDDDKDGREHEARHHHDDWLQPGWWGLGGN